MSEVVADNALMKAAVGGDAVAVEQLLLAHYAALERHIDQKIPSRAARYFSTEDILQVVFTQAFRDIKRFEPRDDASFFAWLRTIADHRLVDELRKIDKGDVQRLTKDHPADGDSLHELIDIVCHESNSPSRAAATQEAIRALEIAIARLPPDQQVAVRMHWLEQRSIDDIARETGRTEAAVRGLVYRGRKNLEAAMGQRSKWLSRD